MPVKKKKPTQWDDGFYVRSYELARAGFSRNEIAEALNVAPLTFAGWEREKPALKKALELAKRVKVKVRPQGGPTRPVPVVPNLAEYVYQRLPPELQDLWDRLEEVNEAPNPVRQIELLFEGKGKKARQWLFLHAMVKHNFNPSEACRAVNVTQKCLEEWAKADPEFTELLTQMKWHLGNFCEASLIELVARHDTPAVLFALKNLMPEKYGDKKTIKLEGTIEHELVPVSKLSDETLRRIIEETSPRPQIGLKELPPEQVQITGGADNGVEVQTEKNGHARPGGVRAPEH